jgi:hypothetical protein
MTNWDLPAAGSDPPEMLLYSLSEFRDVIEACLRAVRPARVMEVGGEEGQFTSTLAAWGEEMGFEAIVIEPLPSDGLRRMSEESKVVRLVVGKSPEALRQAGPADVYFLDGDHNHHTVSSELHTIDEVCRPNPFLVVLHDVGWPCARRDMYYDPSSLPKDSVHRHSFDAGVVPGVAGLVTWGFRGEGHFAWASEEGGARNGVLTGVEEFLEARGGFEFAKIPCVFGLGVLFPLNAPWAAAIREVVSPYRDNFLLARLEQNRIELYLRVLQLKAALDASSKESEKLKLVAEQKTEKLMAELVAVEEGLALLEESSPPGPPVAIPVEGPPEEVGKDRLRAAGYDLYRASLRVRRVQERVRRLLAGR